MELLAQKIQKFESRLQQVETHLNNADMENKLDGVMNEVRSTKGEMKQLHEALQRLVHMLLENQGDS